MEKLKPDYINWVLTLNASQAQEEYHKLEKANRELKKETEATRRKMADLEAEGKRGSAEWTNLRKSIQDNSRAMSENRKKMEEVSKRIDTSSMTVKQLNKQLRQLKREFDDTSKATNPERYDELKKKINETKQAIVRATKETENFKTAWLSTAKLKSVIQGLFYEIGAAILKYFVDTLKNGVNIIIEFEKANSNLAAILGTSKKGIADLTTEAKRLGATTSYTAAEVTRLQIELAKLGFDKTQIKEMEAGVLKFAQAVDTDLGSAAAFAGASMRIFGIEAQDVEEMLASLAIGTTKSALDFSYLQNAMSTVGPVANAFGFSIQDTIALLGNLANAGFDASAAATATRNILLNLADTNGLLAQALGKPVKNLDDLVAGLEKLNAEGIDLNKALELTDKRSVSAFSKFLAGADAITDLRDSVTGCSGAFNAMYAEMSDNVATAIDILKSTIEGVILRFYESRGAIKTLVEALTTVVEWIGKTIDLLGRFSGVIKLATMAFVNYKVTVLAVNVAKKIYNAIIIQGTKLTLAESVALRAQTVLHRTLKAAVLLTAAAKACLTGNVTRASAAWRLFNIVVKANPLGLALTVVSLLIVAFNKFVNETKKASDSVSYMTTASNRHIEALNNAAVAYETQKAKIMALRKVAMDECDTLEHRQKAIQRLNSLIPQYNASLDAETGRYRESKKALDQYLVSLEKKYTMEANKEEYIKLLADREKERRKKYDEWRLLRDSNDMASAVYQKLADRNKDNPMGHGSAERFKAEEYKRKSKEEAAKPKVTFEEWLESQTLETEGALTAFYSYLEKMGLSVADFAEETSEGIANAVDATADHTISRLKEINAELKKLRKEEPEDDADLRRIQDRIKALTEEKKLLMGKSSGKKKREAGTYGEDSLAEATAAADAEHQRQILAINQQKETLSEQELVIAKGREMLRYCGEVSAALVMLRREIDASHTQTLDKITAELNKVAAQSLATQVSIDAATVKLQQENYEKRLEAEQAYYNEQERQMKEAVARQEVSQEAADLYMLDQQRRLHFSQLEVMQQYYDELEDDYSMDAETRRKTCQQLEADMKKMQSQLLTDTAAWVVKIREMSTDTTSRAGINAGFDTRRAALVAQYDQAIAIERKMGNDIVALEQEKNRRIAALNYEQLEQMYQLQEVTGLSWADEYDRELAKLKNFHDQGLIDEKEYQSAKLQLQVNTAKKYFDYYANLSGSMFSAMQDAEIAQSDAKYDVLIQQAKNNGEDTAALEEEKENKKLEIQKKYADVDFAIKASEIVANTAVAIMTGFKQLGPIAGAVAATMLTATGLAQLASAKAERDKVKNMQPGNTAGSSSSAPATATRSVKGYADGGYTGDGGRYEVAGVVHRGEYVVPKPIMDNPRVIDAVGTIEAIRRNRLPASVSAWSDGYADGGPVSGSSTVVLDASELKEVVGELRNALKYIRAYVVYQDIEKAGNVLDKARAPFTFKR